MIHPVYKLLSYFQFFFFKRAGVAKTPPTADASGRRGKMHKVHRAATAQDAEKSTKTLFQGKHIKIYNIRCALFSHFSRGETRKLTWSGRDWLLRKELPKQFLEQQFCFYLKCFWYCKPLSLNKKINAVKLC